MTFRWTDSQSKAINDRDGSLVVAASAGSGKTSAMVERALTLIKSGVPVTKLMLLTFGEAAASEMKEKLLNGLIGYAKESDTDKDYIREQIDDLAFADISTIHGYCKRIVKDNFEAAGVSPSFEVADAETAGVLASKAIKNLLDKESRASRESFIALRDMLSARNDDNLIKIIRMLYEYAAAQPDRRVWLKELFDSEYGGGIEESAAAKYIVANIKSEAESLSTHIAAFQKRATSLNEEIYINNAQSLYERIAGYTNSVSLRDCYLERARERVSKWRYLTGSLKDSVLFEQAQSLREEVKAFEDYILGLLGDYDYAEASEILKGSAPQVAELIRLVNGFDEEYSKLKRENNVLDFSDLERFALEVLRDENIRAEIVKEHDFVFVDEYQDTNYVQESIIRQVSPDNTLFAVGDSKQCIYRFRLAEPKIFIDMLKGHRLRERAVYFNDNFRSAPPILGFVNDVFGVLMTGSFGGIDYKSEAAFNILNEYRKVSSYPAVEVCAITKEENEEGGDCALSGVYSVREAQRFVQSTKGIAEGRIIAEKIMSLVGKEYIADKEGARLIDYGDITLMFKQRSNASGILSELVASGIPLRAGAFALSEQSVELSQLIDYLRFLDNPREDYLLLSAMRSRFGMFSNEELAEMRNRERRGRFYQAAESAATHHDELGEKLCAFYKRADDYRFLAEFTALSELAERIIEQSGYADYLLTLASGLDKLDALKRFIAKLEGKSYARSLAAFADYYAEHSEDMDLGKGELSSENGVNVCTIHASKGLEYPVVILAGAGYLMTRPNKVGGVAADNVLGVGSNYYDENTRSSVSSIVLNAIAAKKRFEDKEDALRLLYVAMTRAKSHLIITGEITPQKLAKKHTVRSASSYLEWLLFAAAENKNVDKNITICAISSKATPRESARPMLFGAPDPILAQKIAEETAYEYPYIASVDLGIKYTATGINMEETERALPLFDSTSRTMGVDYHKVMQYIDYDALTLDAVASELKRMEKEGRISREARDAIDPSEILRCLTSPIMRYAASAKCLREQRFMLSVFADEIKRGAPHEKVLVQGTIDLLILGKRTVIVDFKRSRLPEPTLKERYRKQLEIYKRAAEEALNIKVDIAALYVFGSDATVTVIEE